MSARRGSAVARWFVIRSLAAALAVPAALHASGPSCSVASPDSLTRAWPAPLDHRVSLRARDITLGAALDRLSAASSVAFAFSPDLLPLRRHVCVLVDQRPLGAALELLLRGSGMSPSVVAGRVVLVPQSGSAPSPADARGGEVDELERVVVSGNAEASARRPLTIGVQVIEGERLRQQSLGSLAELLDSAMPGAWVWSPSPASLLAQYGGIRGASSFGTSAPKIYLDGVEVANPLVVTQLDPDAIDRIEIIRGPQGSALYGSDAISGVVNVITRHEGAELPGTHLLVASTVGAGQSAYGGSLVASHDQHLALRLGDVRRSAGLSAQYGQAGAVFPAASARQSIVAADGRMVGASSVWTASARLSDRIAGAGHNPLLAGLAIAATVDSGRGATTTTASVEPAPQRARQYTVGGNVVFGGDARVTHTLLLGVDGYRLANVAAASALYPVPMDSALGALDGAADRVTVRSSSVAHFGGGGAPLTTLTLGGDQSTLRLELPVARVTAPPVGLPWPIASESVERRWNHNTGLFTQVGTAWRDALFVSGGLRVERNDAFTGADRHPLLPMLGIAGVHEFGPASVKLRAAYGRGIRPPTVPARATYVEHGPASSLAAALDPESQAGTELGAEVYVGRVASLTLTRFDQLASGLIQNVLIAVDTQIRAGRPQQHMLYQLQNVGQIGNRGWELQGALTHGALTLSGALAFVDSRVRTVAAGYVGDLRAGDFMLGVPARTESLVATWVARDWTGTLSASRASHWVNYDRLALARDYAAAGGRAGKLGGPQLRDYWMNYDGDTHVRLSGSHPLGGALQLVLVGDNLLGGQLGEPDNVTIRPGRTLSAGLRAGF